MADHGINSVDPTPEALKDRLIRLTRRTDERFRIKDKYNNTKQMAVDHPVAAAMVAVMVACCSVPVACFIAFLLGSLFFLLFGFLVIEGFLLTIGGIILGIALMITGTIALGLCLFIGAAYLAFLAGQKVMTGVNKRIPMRYKSGYKAAMNAWRAEQEAEKAKEAADPEFEMPDAETVTTYTEKVTYK